MKDEVPPALTDAHVKLVEEAQKEGKTVDSQFGLEKSGIAGTAPEKEEGGFCIQRGKGRQSEEKRGTGDGRGETHFGLEKSGIAGTAPEKEEGRFCILVVAEGVDWVGEGEGWLAVWIGEEQNSRDCSWEVGCCIWEGGGLADWTREDQNSRDCLEKK